VIEESEALAQILASIHPLAAEPVPLHQALGKFAAEEQRAAIAMPGFDNSAMDGYAVRQKDASNGAQLTVTAEQPAGQNFQHTLSPGCAIRIFTGAPLPAGADAIVMQEDVDRSGDTITIHTNVEPGEFIRRRGSDLCIGQQILKAGDKITPQKIGIIASQGNPTIPVTRQPRIAIITTGDELKPPGTTLSDGELFNSNGPMLAALAATTCGAATNITSFHAADDEPTLRATIHDALSSSDCLIISGGVSVGDHDLVKPVLASLGVQGGFWRVRIKPGKPLYFGTQSDKIIFGLPGNPVSSFVTYQIFVRAALLKMMGAADSALPLPSIPATLAAPVQNPGDRPHYLRGTYNPTSAQFTPSSLQQSHALFALSQSNALLRLEPEQSLEKDSPVKIHLIP
jgi:molybdopterin molybdotransferase